MGWMAVAGAWVIAWVYGFVTYIVGVRVCRCVDVAMHGRKCGSSG